MRRADDALSAMDAFAESPRNDRSPPGSASAPLAEAQAFAGSAAEHASAWLSVDAETRHLPLHLGPGFPQVTGHRGHVSPVNLEQLDQAILQPLVVARELGALRKSRPRLCRRHVGRSQGKVLGTDGDRLRVLVPGEVHRGGENPAELTDVQRP